MLKYLEFEFDKLNISKIDIWKHINFFHYFYIHQLKKSFYMNFQISCLKTIKHLKKNFTIIFQYVLFHYFYVHQF